jgi:hypothetical protein
VNDNVMVSRDFLRNVDEALQRHLDRHAPRQIPVHRADSDILQAEVRKLLSAAPEPPAPGVGEEWALDVSGRQCHDAAHAFWNWWAEYGETHRHGYYESTWGAINAALRVAGVVRHTYRKPLPPEITKSSLGPEKEPPADYGEIPSEFAQLATFYSVDSLSALIRMQEEHVRRLQEKLPPPRDAQPGKTRFA